MKYALLAIGVVSSTIVGAVAYDVYDDRRHSIEVLDGTPLLAEAYPLGYGEKQNRAIAMLDRSRPRVLRIRYGKDYMAIRVRTESGLEGWVIYGPSVEVME